AGEVRGLLGRPASVGIGGAARNKDTPAAELEEEEHLQAPSQGVSTVKKSKAMIESACACEKARQLSWPRSPAGETAECRRILATVVAETLTPTPASSPTIRLYPQRWFSRARRSTSSRISSDTAGLPGRRRAYVHRFRTSWRCQPSSASGRTKNERLLRPSSWPAAAR